MQSLEYYDIGLFARLPKNKNKNERMFADLLKKASKL